jgi:uncharacterized membrane protein
VSGERIVAGGLAVAGLLAATGAVLDVAGGLPAAVRAVATVVFLLLGPGWAFSTLLRPAGAAERLVVAVGGSVAAGILVAQTMVVTTSWHPVGALVGAVAVSLPALLLAAGRRDRVAVAA